VTRYPRVTGCHGYCLSLHAPTMGVVVYVPSSTAPPTDVKITDVLRPEKPEVSIKSLNYSQVLTTWRRKPPKQRNLVPTTLQRQLPTSPPLSRVVPARLFKVVLSPLRPAVSSPTFPAVPFPTRPAASSPMRPPVQLLQLLSSMSPAMRKMLIPRAVRRTRMRIPRRNLVSFALHARDLH
jgi:hypothetical protein